MKVKADKPAASYTPWDLTITVESAEEAAKLYAIFDYIPNTKLLDDGGDGIRLAIYSADQEASRKYGQYLTIIRNGIKQ